MLRPKRSLGQNFLIDKNILKKITQNTIIKNEHIIEIGPGSGNLTEIILEKNPKSLIIIEKDSNLIPQLRSRFRSFNNLKIINDDILKINLEKIMTSKTIIFGNLPYNISTKILINLIKFENWPPKYNKLILMFQKEVGERIKAKYNQKNYGRLSIFCDWRLNILRNFDITKNSFFPKPKVSSTLIEFEPKNTSQSTCIKCETLEKVTNIMFSNRRKMINKAINKIFKNSKEVVNNLDLNINVRPGEISKDIYVKLAKFLEKSVN